MSEIITVSRLSKSFSRQGVRQDVLKDLDLTIRREDFTVIMGPSGSGKSTLLYALSGMDRPSDGSVSFDGREISSLSEDRLARFRRDHCGFVFQQIHLLEGLSVQDNVLVVGLLGKDKRGAVVRSDALFDQVGLDPGDRMKFPGQLSGGEAQRAAVVRALVNDPDVLFADEPTGALNSEYGQMVLDLLTGLHRRGQAVVMVTHDLRSAMRGTRILYLRDGTIQGELAQPPYAGDDDARRDALTAFLNDLGW